jgi:hypothetical protein
VQISLKLRSAAARDVLSRLQAHEVVRVLLAGEVDNVLDVPKDDSSFKRARRRRHRRIERRKPAAFSECSRDHASAAHSALLADRNPRAVAAGTPRAGDASRSGTDREHVEIIAASRPRSVIAGLSIFWLSQHRRAGKL